MDTKSNIVAHTYINTVIVVITTVIVDGDQAKEWDFEQICTSSMRIQTT